MMMVIFAEYLFFVFLGRGRRSNNTPTKKPVDGVDQARLNLHYITGFAEFFFSLFNGSIGRSFSIKNCLAGGGKCEPIRKTIRFEFRINHSAN
jgi:hypothetical protein